MFKKHKKIIFTVLFIAVAIALFFVFSDISRAADDELLRDSTTATVIRHTLGYIVEALVALGGAILILLLKALNLLAGYNDFINAEPVAMGWVIVRDLSNMFFILILLLIAFATILHQESYQYKKLLPRLLIMAILINFSKTIAGLFIDFAQVIMLTFVNGFSGATSVNVVVGLGINKVLSLGDATTGTIDALTVLSAYLLALIYIVVTLVTVGIFCFTLAYRIVMIWLLVILSPLAFLLSAFPAGQSKAKEWWDEFSKAVVIGPVLAFFIWLSLAAMQPNINNPQNSQLSDTVFRGQEGKRSNVVETNPVSAADDLSVFSTFIVGIALMWGGLYMANKIGGEVGGWAGGMAGKARGIGVGLARRAAMAPVKYAGAKIGEAVTDARYKLAEKSGVAFIHPEYKAMKEEGKKRWRAEKTAGMYQTAESAAARAKETGSALHLMRAMAGTPQAVYERGRAMSLIDLGRVALTNRGKLMGEREGIADNLGKVAKAKKEAEIHRTNIDNPQKAREKMMQGDLEINKTRVSEAEKQRERLTDKELSEHEKLAAKNFRDKVKTKADQELSEGILKVDGELTEKIKVEVKNKLEKAKEEQKSNMSRLSEIETERKSRIEDLKSQGVKNPEKHQDIIKLDKERRGALDRIGTNKKDLEELQKESSRVAKLEPSNAGEFLDKNKGNELYKGYFDEREKNIGDLEDERKKRVDQFDPAVVGNKGAKEAMIKEKIGAYQTEVTRLENIFKLPENERKIVIEKEVEARRAGAQAVVDSQNIEIVNNPQIVAKWDDARVRNMLKLMNKENIDKMISGATAELAERLGGLKAEA